MTYLAVEAVRGKSDWEWKPLRRVTRIRREANADSSSRLLALSSERGVEYRADDGGRQLPSDDTITGYWRVRPGDLVFNPMWAIGGGVAVSTLTGAVSTAYRIYEPSPSVWPRFLHHWLRSQPVIEQYRLLVRGSTTFDRSVTREDLDGMPIPLPPLSTQRAIADYLDRETGRLDALIAAKRRLVALSEARWEAELSLSLWHGSQFEPVQLKFLAGLPTSGNRDHSSFISDPDGIPCVRGVDVSSGEIDIQHVLCISAGDHAAHLNTIVRWGDLLILRSGATAGRVALVPEKLDGCNCVDVVIVRRTTRLDPRYLVNVFRTREVREQMALRSAGALQPHFNAVDAGVLRLPYRPMTAQLSLVATLEKACAKANAMARVLSRQVGLLQEHRQALVTSAVTGQLDIPEAA